MASQLTVLGPGARRHLVKVTPGTYLSDVFHEACTKFRLDPAQYSLKHNEKAVDLSRSLRLSGLASGAKLELTQVSRSPSVVSVALQLPDNTRLLDKFPSNTSLWLVLRKFESGVAGGSRGQKNFTARGVPRTGGDSGSGRLYHEAPVLHIMGRDYGSFVDLQKTLGQIGFNNGSVLLKLSFFTSQDPLEAALERMEQYFKSVDGEKGSGAHSGSVGSIGAPAPTPSDELQQAVQDAERELSPDRDSTPVAETPQPEPHRTPSSDSAPVTVSEPVFHNTPTSDASTEVSSTRPTLVYGPPSSATPQAARQTYDPPDYVPSVEHAKSHQATLNRASLNRRLPTDAEIEAERLATAQKLGEVKEVSIKVRFPDQSSAVAPFRAADTVEDLYAHVQSLMAHGDQPFSLQLAGPKGQTALAKSKKKLIADVGLMGRVMVNVIWRAEASAEARGAPSMKVEVAQKQQQHQFKEVAEPRDNEIVGSTSRDKGPSDGKEKKDGVPKWLKFGKK